MSSGRLIFDEADEPLVPGEIGEGDILHVCYGAVIQRVSPVQILDIFFITRVSQPGNAG